MKQAHETRLQLLDGQQERILNAMHFLWQHPETGYREWKSQEYLAAEYEKLGYTLTYAGNIPRFYTDIDTDRPGPTLLILAELDALFCAAHPDTDPETGAVHSCGQCRIYLCSSSHFPKIRMGQCSSPVGSCCIARYSYLQHVHQILPKAAFSTLNSQAGSLRRKNKSKNRRILSFYSCSFLFSNTLPEI